jgi:hypothetical protein
MNSLSFCFCPNIFVPVVYLTPVSGHTSLYNIRLSVYISSTNVPNAIQSTSDKMYKEVSIISRTGAAIWSKTNFVPTGYHIPQRRLLTHVCTVPNASAIF